ncbi:MAG: hypothetical protein DRN16_02395 [Thermoplasmata archaeon]|nr:MAG: hypothetical protein DRN16_02395 [Thermoplasmata archaeon]
MNNILLYTISDTFNITNFTANIFRYALDPYLSLFGNITWGFIFGFVGAAIYVNNKSLPTIFGYLIIVGVIFSVILPAAIYSIFALITAIIGTTILYEVLVEKR